ncbi:capsid maturation protease [Panine betaherpesvirus 2]|uniref:Capsid scaffolding protein n=2 Tax=Panine betaherpesvirus 2 TaxID=188763 RepID=Q8QS19_9BETA|nr:capsid maturation protease [Panine betaherpesvirus 2]AAM00719.1 capsid maturation protease [Panine betaherpesvirus 2]QXV67829.1 capsid maturation protease [Panine betaherpesvirus 2]
MAGGDLSSPSSSVVYVGGFLTRYDQPPDEAELLLPRDVVERWLGSGGDGTPMPLNVNHDDAAVVGHVAAMKSVRDGLFCLGCVTSPRFLEIVSRASEKSELVSRGPPCKSLRPDKVVEFLSGSYAGLSLSSRRCCPSSVEASEAPSTSTAVPESAPFKHVALCSVGRRRGTLAVYGRDPDWVLQRFPDLTAADRDDLRAQWRGCGGAPAGDPFRSDSYGLLGNSVDALYIRERLPKLRYDKQLVGVTERESYVKASVSPEAAAEPAVTPCDIKADEAASAAQPPPPLPPPRRSAPAPSKPNPPSLPPPEAVEMSHPLTAAAAPGAAAIPPPPSSAVVPAPLTLPHDGVYLPKDAFFSLIGASRQPAVPATAPPSYPAVGAVPAYPHHPSPYSHQPPPPPPHPATGLSGGAYGGMHSVGYDDLAARHFGAYDPGVYWARRYDHLPPPPSYPAPYAAYGPPPPPPPQQQHHHHHRRRDMMDDAPSTWERYPYDGAPPPPPSQQHGGGGHRQKQRSGKRRKEASQSSSSDEDLSFPGEAEHGRARKKLKNHGGAQDGGGGEHHRGGGQHQRYDELRDAIHELKRDLFAARQGSALLSAAIPVPGVSHSAAPSPTTTTASSPAETPMITGDATPPPQTTPAGKVGAAERAAAAVAGVVNASCRVDHAVAGTSGGSSSTTTAAGLPAAALALQNPPKDMVDLNRRLFVAALNKME